MPLRIPGPYIRAYSWLASLPDDTATALERAFAAPDRLSRKHIAAAAADASGEPEALVDLLFESLLGLMRSLQDASLEGTSIDEVSVDVSTDPELELDDATRVVLKERVVRLMAGQPVWRLAKAIDLQSDHGNVFRGARMYAEIRPMFEDDVALAPNAASITHTLKIDVLNRQLDLESLYIALDDEDVLALYRVLGRELEKSKTLTKTLKSSGLSPVTLSETGDEEESGR